MKNNTLRFVTPRVNQGQIVTVSYAMIPGIVMRQEHDASDGSVMYCYATAHPDDDGDYQQRPPAQVGAWKECDRDSLERMAAEEGMVLCATGLI